MSILVDRSTRVVVQGITGSAGSFHSEQMLAYGTALVAGVTPGRGGTKFQGKVPIFQTVQDARSLREICQRPVLGAVSMLTTVPMLKRRRMMHAAFGSGLASLLLFFGAWVGWVSWALRS